MGEGDRIDTWAGKRVPVVEDNPVDMTVTVAMLEQWGVQVAQASDGLALVEAMRSAEVEGRPFDAERLRRVLAAHLGRAGVTS